MRIAKTSKLIEYDDNLTKPMGRGNRVSKSVNSKCKSSLLSERKEKSLQCKIMPGTRMLGSQNRKHKPVKICLKGEAFLIKRLKVPNNMKK